MSTVTRISAALLVVVFAVPAIASVSDEDIDRAREEVRQTMARSEELGREVQEAWAQQFALEKEITDLRASIEYARAQVAEAELRLEEIAVEMYMGSASTAAIQVLFSSSDEAYEAGRQYLEEVSGDEVDIINQLRSFRAELDRQTERLSEATAEQEVVTAELETKAAALQDDLAEAQAIYDSLVAQQAAEEEQRRLEEEARRRAEEEARNATTTTTPAEPTTTSPGETTTSDGGATTTTSSSETTTTEGSTSTTSPPSSGGGGGVCPVDGAVSFSDTWGDPRSGGRAHEGVDMIAARNTPVVATRNGSILRITTGSLSGLAVWLAASNGDHFFYAHLEKYGDISVGQKVKAGDVIGYVGTSGNAPDWLPHLHFERHPDGGAAVNPYPYVKAIC